MTTETHEPIDIREKGRRRTASPSCWIGGCSCSSWPLATARIPRALIRALEKAKLSGALYEDVNDPRGVALLTLSEDPEYFVAAFASFSTGRRFQSCAQAGIHDAGTDLRARLRARPGRGPVHAAAKPHRRSGVALGRLVSVAAGGFLRAALADEQRIILLEHGGIGRAFGKAGLGHDIRLACHGLDKNDNDFVIGLLGPKLYPLSAIVQRMRKTEADLAAHRAHGAVLRRQKWPGKAR